MTTPGKNIFSFPEVRIVEASAGSGKTYALAKRYVQLLINPRLAQDEIPLKNILAITFTNRATIEMKERILEFLKKIAIGGFSTPREEEDLLSSLGVPKEAAKQKAFFILECIIRNYNFFQVQTIDSFINTVVAGSAFKLDLSSRFRIKTDSSDYLAYSLDLLIDRAHRDPAVERTFKDFLTQYLRVENRPGWFPRDNILALMAELYRGMNTYGGAFAKQVACTAGDIIALKKNIRSAMTELHGKLPAGTHKRFAEKLGSLVADGRDTFSLDELSAYFTYDAFPVGKSGGITKDVEKLWRRIRKDLATLSIEEAYCYFNCYIDIFNLVERNLRRLSRKDDVMFLEELNRQASELFAGDRQIVPELYYRLATRYRHFLIDEFQDTSELQWRNLLPLVEEALASAGSLYYVGDKKQAIYRFRGGEAGLFDRIPADFAAFRPRREVLSRNYRSAEAIVAFNNGVFAAENLCRFMSGLSAEKDEEVLAGGDAEEVLGVFADSRQACHREGGAPGYVRVEHSDGDSSGEAAASLRDKIAGLVHELHRRFSYRDIAVLARDNRDIERITGWLIEADIPVESERTLNVRENPRVKELVSFLRYLNSPIDSLSFASFILSDVFLAEAGLRHEDMREFVFRMNLERPSGSRVYLYREFRSAYPELWDKYFEEFFVNVGFVPLYELVVSIMGAFRVAERFPGHQAFFMRFLELVKRQEEENTSVASFLEFLDRAPDSDLFIAVTDADAVKLLTIHKAKGLEFPAVVIPFLQMDLAVFGRGAGSFEIAAKGDGLTLVRLGKKYLKYSEELRAIHRRKVKKVFIDELNAVYVALTRAREELYAFVPKKAARSLNPVRLLIPEVRVERGIPSKERYLSKSGARALFELPLSAYNGWIKLLKEEFGDDGSLRNRDSIARGEYLHYALSLLDNLEGKDARAEIARAAAQAAAAYPSRSSVAELARLLTALVEDERARRFFFTGRGKVFREKEIIDAFGRVRRPDRLIVTEDEAWVVDFKSAPAPGGDYAGQVHDYVRLVEDIFPGHTVKGYLLYLDTGGVEEVR